MNIFLSKIINTSLIAILFVSSCKEGNEGQESTFPSNHAQLSPLPKKMVSFKLADTDKQLGLTQEKRITFRGRVAHCLSGFEVSIDEESNGFEVVEGDRSCQFRLDSLSVNQEIYTFTGEESWSEGEFFNITGSKGTILPVTIVSQLESPINGPQTVIIMISSKIEQGSDHFIDPNEYSEGINVGSGLSIDLELKHDKAKVTKDHQLSISFWLNCLSPMNKKKCSGIDVSKLIAGITNDMIPDDLNEDQCTKIAFHHSSSGHFTSRSSILDHGGVMFKNLSVPLLDNLADFHNLTLAIATGEEKGSCQYFSLLVSVSK